MWKPMFTPLCIRFVIKEGFNIGKVCVVYRQKREKELPRVGVTDMSAVLRGKETEGN